MLAILIPVNLVVWPLTLLVLNMDSLPYFGFLLFLWFIYSIFAFYGGAFIGYKLDKWGGLAWYENTDQKENK